MEGIPLMLSLSAIAIFAIVAYLAWWLSGKVGPFAAQSAI